jgi:hypothetical protein
VNKYATLILLFDDDYDDVEAILCLLLMKMARRRRTRNLPLSRFLHVNELRVKGGYEVQKSLRFKNAIS